MTRYNREDPRTVLPQLEKEFNNKLEKPLTVVDSLFSVQKDGSVTLNVKEIPLTGSQCTIGGYNCAYQIGNIVFLSFNFNITTATSSYDYISGLPKPIHNWACSGTTTGSANQTRWYVSKDGTLRADGATITGWQNGSVVYICE